VRIPRVPPASLRWLAVRLGQTGRFALPSLVGVSQAAPAQREYALIILIAFTPSLIKILGSVYQNKL
jgi:hypothetical protein